MLGDADSPQREMHDAETGLGDSGGGGLYEVSHQLLPFSKLLCAFLSLIFLKGEPGIHKGNAETAIAKTGVHDTVCVLCKPIEELQPNQANGVINVVIPISSPL